jgi:DNA-binding HxlR family transcriptional regulator
VTNTKRWYEDACGAAHALELLGERWALLVVRELMFGPRRFGEIRAGLPGISANILTQRLESLEQEGIVIKREQPSTAYELTAWGYESEPIFQTLGRWAARSPSHDPTLPISAASILLSFRTMLVVARAKDMRARVGLVLNDESYVANVRDGELTIRREPLRDVAVTITGEPGALGAAVYGGVPLAESDLRIDGDLRVAKRFVGLFSLPPKVTAKSR